MIIRRYLQWAATAPAAARAEGALALARVYLAGELEPADLSDAETALTSLLDDGSPLVRMALAQALAATPLAPHHVVTALAADRSDIAAVVLEASPLFGDAELVDAAALGDGTVQSAIARRAGVSVGVAAALAEVGTLSACLDLCRNETAVLAPVTLSRLIRRFGADAELRELIGRRPDLDPGLRYELVAATTQALARFVTTRGWMSADRTERVTREAQDQAGVAIAADAERAAGAEGISRLIAHLRQTARLTPAFLLRALLCGNLSLFETAISDLSGVSIGRVAGFLRGAQSLGFSALYARSNLPPQLLPVFQAAVRAAAQLALPEAADGAVLQRACVRAVLTACDGAGAGRFATVIALLRRLDAEAALVDARSFARATALDRPAALAPQLSFHDREAHLKSAARDEQWLRQAMLAGRPWSGAELLADDPLIEGMAGIMQ